MPTTSDGSVYPFEGAWRANLVVGWRPDGRPIRRTRRAPTERAARAALAEMRRERDAGRRDWSNPVAADWLHHWLTAIAAPSVGPNTLRGYTVTIARFRGWLTEYHPRLTLDSVAPEHIDAFTAWMGTQGVGSPGNVRAHLRVLHTAFGTAVDRGHITRSPLTGVKPPKGAPRAAAPLSLDEARQVLATAARTGVRHPVRWWFALCMGWRQGEILGLEWDAVNLDAGTVHRRQQLQRMTGRGLVLAPLKGAAGDAVLPLPPGMITGLQEWRTTQIREATPLGSAYRPPVLPYRTGPTQYTDPTPRAIVFTRPHGQAWSREDDWAAWGDLLAAAGVRHVRAHDARHSMATAASEQGVSGKVLQAILGHAHEKTTAIYTHATDPAVVAALTAMERALTG